MSGPIPYLARAVFPLSPLFTVAPALGPEPESKGLLASADLAASAWRARPSSSSRATRCAASLARLNDQIAASNRRTVRRAMGEMRKPFHAFELFASTTVDASPISAHWKV